MQPPDGFPDRLLLDQASFLDARGELAQIRDQALLLLAANSAILLHAPRAAAEHIGLVAAALQLHLHLRLFLKRIARRGLADHLRKPVAFEFRQPAVAFGLAGRHQVVQVARADLGQVLVVCHAPIHHHRLPGLEGHPRVEPVQHRLQRTAVLQVALEDLVRQRKPLRIDHQPHHHLLAVRPVDRASSRASLWG